MARGNSPDMLLLPHDNYETMTEPATALNLQYKEEDGTLQQGLQGLQQLKRSEPELARISDNRIEGRDDDEKTNDEEPAADDDDTKHHNVNTATDQESIDEGPAIGPGPEDGKANVNADTDADAIEKPMLQNG